MQGETTACGAKGWVCPSGFLNRMGLSFNEKSESPSLDWMENIMLKTGSQILWECLEQQGVTTVFGYPGGAILPAYDALKYSNIHHVLVRHEQGATHMADGYARATGRP